MKKSASVFSAFTRFTHTVTAKPKAAPKQASCSCPTLDGTLAYDRACLIHGETLDGASAR